LPYPFPDVYADPLSNPFDAEGFEIRLRALSHRDPFLFPRAHVPEHFRHSSVLICFWREEEDLRVILTKRAATLSGHPGQMSFPGGKLEPGEAFLAAAIRETEEEIGVPRDRIEVLGRLDDAWSGAGHLLVPVVGWLDGPPEFVPNPAEVEEIHTPSVMNLMLPAAYSEEEAQIGDRTFINPILSWDDGRLFGLSTDLLIEALLWATGEDVEHGTRRLDSLQSFLKFKEDEGVAGA
jgi:8-oxo-dGTP pyrophosphatase MutT (NUDIX family)